MGAALLAAFFCFFFLAFLGASLADLAAGSACVELTDADAEGAGSAAQTGAANIKVHSSSNIFLMLFLPCCG